MRAILPAVPTTVLFSLIRAMGCLARRPQHLALGVLPVVTAGLAILGLAGIVALTGAELANFYVALVFLGIGWNFGFVGATTLLATAHEPNERGRAQGLNDMMVFGCVTVASLASVGLMNCSGGGTPVDGWNAVNIAMIPFLSLAGAALVWLSFGSHRAGVNA